MTNKQSIVKCFLVICILLAVVFTVFSIGWVPFLNSQVTRGAKRLAALTKENENSWKDIPGSNDITILHHNYLFSCVNMDDVIYRGQTPIFEQYGPYIYRETDDWTNVTYDQDLEVTG